MTAPKTPTILKLNAIALGMLMASAAAYAGDRPAPMAQNSQSQATQSVIKAPVEPVPDALRNPVQSFYEAHTARQLQNGTIASVEAGPMNAISCSSVYAGYGNRTGQALVDHILNNPANCIDALFNGDSTAIAAFQANNMLTVANAAANMARSYNPNNTNSETIGKLYYFLRAGYYVQYYNSSAIPNYPASVRTAVRSALDNLFANGFFYTNSEVHARNIQDAITLIDSAGENTRYLYVVKEWLQRWDRNMANGWNMRSAVNGIFTVLFRGHYDTSFVQAATNDSVLMQRLGNFATADWMLDTGASFMQENAAAELARFLQYRNSPTASTVVSEVNRILSQYSMNGRGAGVWLKAASTVDFYGRCAEFSICGFKEQLEQQVLSIRHSCNSSLKFRVQDMNTRELNDSCQTLVAQENYFHSFLRTNRQPVADDLNSTLEMVVFDSSNDYGQYAGLFFGIDTNNGGMYLEGEPSRPGNQARFIAYEAEWLRPDFVIWNLTHEMVHYLDGRFNLKGNFADARVGTHKTVWWIEGLAEYVSKKNRNDHAINLGRSRSVSLSQIFSNTYMSGTERIYHWGYLAVRFMFERKPEKVNELLAHFRTGNYDNYLAAINAIGTSYDSEFSSWLNTVQSNDSEPVVTLPNPGNPVDPVEPPTSDRLVNGQAKTNLNAARSEWLHYYIDVPAGQNKLTITQSGGTGDADLHVRFGQQPTNRQYDCRPYRSGNNESCEFDSPAAGRWYVSTNAHRAFQNVTITATYSGNTTTPVEPTDPISCENPVSYVQVADGNEYCVAAASNNDYTYFYLYNSVANTRYTFNLQGQGSGNADLYFSNSTWPTATNYQQKSTNAQSAESITTAPLPVGWAYISVHANPERPATKLKVTATSAGVTPPNACATQGPVSYVQLQANNQYCIASSATDDYTYFYLYNDQANASYTFNLYGTGPGNADLYLSTSVWPTAQHHQLRSRQAGSNESITTPALPLGWVYIAVHANGSRPETTLTVTRN